MAAVSGPLVDLNPCYVGLAFYMKMIAPSQLYEKLMPSHNEPWFDKAILEDVLDGARQIRAGAGAYTEDVEDKDEIRRHDYSRFSMITKA